MELNQRIREKRVERAIWPEVFTVDDLADYLNTSKRQAYDFIHRADPPIAAIRLSHKILRVRKCDVDEWLGHFKQSGDSEIDRIVSEVLRPKTKQPRKSHQAGG